MDGSAGPDADERVAAVEDVLLGLRALARAIDGYRHALSASHDLGTADVIALAYLAYDEPASARAVADRTGLTPGSVTALLDRLERRGHLVRRRPADNRRSVLITLTPSGRELADGMFQPLRPLLERASTEDGAPDPRRLAHCLHRIAALMNELGAPGE